MRTLTRNLARENPFGRRVSAHHLDFSDPDGLRRSMEWANVLYNTYWIRVNHKGRTHQQCVEQTKVMFHAARDAGSKKNSTHQHHQRRPRFRPPVLPREGPA